MSEEQIEETPIHEWAGPEADALRKSLEHIEDLKHVVSCCDLLLQLPPNETAPLAQALYESAVITYARCFNSGRRSRITEARVASTAGREAVVWHRYFMKMRDQHVAHTVLPHAHLALGIVVTPEGAGPFEVLGTGAMVLRRIADDADGIDALRALALQLIALHGEAAKSEGEAFMASARRAGEWAVRAQPRVEYQVPGVDVSAGLPSHR